MTLLSLPDDIKANYLISFLSIKSIFSLGTTCKQYLNICRDPRTWIILIRRDFKKDYAGPFSRRLYLTFKGFGYNLSETDREQIIREMHEINNHLIHFSKLGPLTFIRDVYHRPCLYVFQSSKTSIVVLMKTVIGYYVKIEVEEKYNFTLNLSRTNKEFLDTLPVLISNLEHFIKISESPIQNPSWFSSSSWFWSWVSKNSTSKMQELNKIIEPYLTNLGFCKTHSYERTIYYNSPFENESAEIWFL